MIRKQKEIDFSMLPKSAGVNTPRSNALLATGITGGILFVIGSVALLTNSRNRENVMTVLGSLLMIAFVGVVIYCFMRLTSKLSIQKQVMRRFADANGWRFDGNRRFGPDNSLAPPSGTSLEATVIRYKITGELKGISFDYYQLVVSRGNNKGAWMVGNDASAFITILRLAGNIPIKQKYPDLIYEQTAGYTFITHFGNAISATEVKRLFGSVV